jgi:cystathionine gamma-synthase
MSIGYELITNPLWRAEDLGKPIPDSPHAASACLPMWADNIGYEEQDPRVHEKLTTGYPRFVYNRLCEELFADCEERFAKTGEACLAFPSEPAAERFAAFMQNQAAASTQIHAFGLHAVHAACFDRQHADVAKSYWQHAGEGVSSRLAEACLNETPADDATACKQTIKERVAQFSGVDTEDVFLYPNGMNAIVAVHRVLLSLFPDRKSVQFGFPYVDSLKLQEKFGPGVHFYPKGNNEELNELKTLLKQEAISGLFTEFPSNPLLLSPNLNRLAESALQHGFPVIVDETLATWWNAELLSVADVLTTSLTKFFSGIGDVTAGSVVLNRTSPFYSQLSSGLKEQYEDLFWGADAVVLEQNSRDFAERMPVINRNAEALADFLNSHPHVAEVYYPKYQTPHEYNAFRKPDGGYGGLLSILLKNAAETAPKFYDALCVSKGPNLGTNYSLVCPFTILAHYNELEFAESCGVSRYLIRISVGLEEPGDLINRFDEALTIL